MINGTHKKKKTHLSSFNTEAWQSLSQTDRDKHTLSDCKECQERYAELSNAFPVGVRRGKTRVNNRPITCPTINLTKKDLSSPEALGSKVLKELTNISQQIFSKTGQEVLAETPRSKLICKPTAKVLKQKKKQTEKEIKNAIVKDKEELACDLVLQNRISWNTYDKIRKTEGMTTPKRPATTLVQCRKRKYRNLSGTLQIDKDRLLHEARLWPDDKDINWSKLARDYGLNSPNGGQIIKEFLEKNNIPTASIYQRPSRAKRRCIKKVGAEGVSFPMYPTVKHGRQKLLERINKGEIAIGKEVVPSSYQNFAVNSHTHNIQENTVHISARKVSLLNIRKKLLQKHESLGIIRDKRDEYFNNLSSEDMANLSQKLGTCVTADKIQQLKKMCRTRHIKLWHDHSSIAAHGYLLVLVSIIYDPAFFYTTEEMKRLKGWI